jgi:hypothetical protein
MAERVGDVDHGDDRCRAPDKEVQHPSYDVHGHERTSGVVDQDKVERIIERRECRSH